MPDFSSLQTLLEKYFPNELNPQQIQQFELAFNAYLEWNAMINVISRKDIDNLAERHFLHSLAIAKSIRFRPGTQVLDAGTGGGFPGIPLAIFFPETQFMLADSREKKIKVVQEVAQAAGLKNVQWGVHRVEQLKTQYDFVVSRAVASMEEFVPWVRHLIHCKSQNTLANGILYLRGGDIKQEMAAFKRFQHHWQATDLATLFDEEFFASKSLLHLSFCPKPKPAKK